MFGLFKKSNYRRSKDLTEIDFEVSEFAAQMASNLMSSTFTEDRQNIAQDLLDELTDNAKIDVANVKISDKKQYHKRSPSKDGKPGRVVFKQYGYYRPKSRYIYISNKTAVQGKNIAPKTFLDTLLHEWMHHYDHCHLKLNSIHTSGFYSRLKSLKAALLPTIFSV